MKLNPAWTVLMLISGLILIFTISTPRIFQIVMEEGGSPKVYPIPNVYTFYDMIVVCLLSITFGYSLFRAIILEEKHTLLRRLGISELLRLLKPDELKIYETIRNSGVILQSELIEKTGFSTAKVSQALNLLEAYGLIEKKKKGRENVLRIIKEKS
ncbi:MAG: winged helix-turn-helix transcriptional regulator [Nitrososphaerota archaeon]|nr:winged helix-turn-helix transcriptional regulator [Nitrososphaerota archaeon]